MTRTEKYPETSTFTYFNANPHNRITGDCWLRAICTGLGEPYNNVLKEMVEITLETGYEMSCDKAVELYMKKKGWVKMKQPRKADNTKLTGKEFCKKLNATETKSVIANIGGHHIVAIKKATDGKYKVHDIWDSTDGCIGNYYIKA